MSHARVLSVDLPDGRHLDIEDDEASFHRSFVSVVLVDSGTAFTPEHVAAYARLMDWLGPFAVSGAIHFHRHTMPLNPVCTVMLRTWRLGDDEDADAEVMATVVRRAFDEIYEEEAGVAAVADVEAFFRGSGPAGDA